MSAAIGAVCAILVFGLGWLARHDYQVVTNNQLSVEVAELRRQGLARDMQMERMNSYLLSIYSWTLRMSASKGWPEPPKPELFLPNKGRPYNHGFIPDASAEERESPAP